MNNWYVRCKIYSVGIYITERVGFLKAGIQNLRVWLAGENLFDISNVKDGFDPEANYEMGTYSGFRSLLEFRFFGLDITF